MTAKRVVLELLTATDGHELPAAALVAAAAVVDVAETSVRVALTRLVAAGTLEVTARGVYRLGAATRAMTAQITSWRELERSVRKWDGAWVMASLLGPRERRRDRAVALLGLRELAPGLAVRPDNLAGGAAGVRERLAELGASELIVARAELGAADDARARALWDGAALTAGYVRRRADIDRWLGGGDALDLRRAAREAFVFGGGDVLRAIVTDPRLPEPLVDVAARRAMVDAMVRLDKVGRALWARLAEEHARAA